jgi:hypothetical protein
MLTDAPSIAFSANSGSENVGQMEKKIADHLRLAKQRPKVDVALSFNEAAGVLAISTAQLQHLLKEHSPTGRCSR